MESDLRSGAEKITPLCSSLMGHVSPARFVAPISNFRKWTGAGSTTCGCALFMTMTTSIFSSGTAALRFHVLGDSLAAGVGCARIEDTLGHQLASRLRSTGRAVDLNVLAVSGARSADLAAQVRAAVSAGVDLALIVIGANDLTALVPTAVGARLLHDAVTELRRVGARVVVATAPDLSMVPHVPAAYRAVVAAASEHYARAQGEAVLRAGGIVAPVGRELATKFAADHDLFSSDRFHPSPAGYALVASALGPYLEAAVDGRTAA
jgi:lysophospholipase L1-like esterase